MKQNILYCAIFLSIFLISCINYQPSAAEVNENPRYYSNVNIIVISRIFDTIYIDGFHNISTGFGFDESISLKGANNPRLLGLFLIYNDTNLLEEEKHGGWLHTTIQISNFSGWIKNQHNNFHLIMFGECEQVKLTTYRER
jgi:hypothetical protein